MFKPLNFVFTGFYSIMNKSLKMGLTPIPNCTDKDALCLNIYKEKVKANKISNSRMKSYGSPITN